MNQYHGYYWPDIADANVLRYINHAEDMKVALKGVKNKGTVVQAGGHCGIWPLWLSKKFQKVYTFEPNPDNWECLQVNCRKAENIQSYNACLGREPTKIRMTVNGKNTGGHKGTQDPGETPVVTIDGLQLDTCDLIVLDVEGMELPALQGAYNSLREFKPVLMLEDRGHGDRYGWGGSEALFEWLKDLGYRIINRVAYDVVLTCSP